MSSTSNVQNYLSNVFRPYYVYDSNTGFQANLAISNVTSITQEVIETQQLLVGDSNRNVYVGINAGNDPTIAAAKICCNVTAVGYGAGNLISNVSNSVYIGADAGSEANSSDSVIAIGTGAKGQGISNIYIGKNTGPTSNGTGNIFLGNSIIPTTAISNTLLIGSGSNVAISANLATKQVGIGGITSPTRSLDVSGSVYISGDLTVQGDVSANSVTFNIGKLMTVNGSALVPSHTFSNDASTGMYLRDISQLAFSTGGVQRVIISNANVGIGTTSPSQLLDVQGDIAGLGARLSDPYNIAQQTGSGSRNWSSIVSSSDGSQIAATDKGGYIYVSYNGGLTWTTNGNSSDIANWSAIASSSDGTILLATIAGDRIAANTTSGVGPWFYYGTLPTANWTDIVSSSDGLKAAACAYGGYIYTNPNISISAWTTNGNSSGIANWTGIASSSDGTRLVADVSGGYIYTSSNAGVTWTTNGNSSGIARWSAAASSSNGLKLAVTAYGGYIYTSSNAGVTWTTNSNSSGIANWTAIASSSDGTKLGAVEESGYIYISVDGGLSWTRKVNGGSRSWRDIAMSSDGTKLAAAVGSGYIYTGKPSIYLITSNGNVGIGTSTPSQTLDVSGDISGNRIAVSNGTAAAPTHAFNTDLTSGMYLQTPGKLSFSTSGVQRMCISGTNIGIGTSTPSQTLHVSGDILGSRITALNGTEAAPTHTFNADLSSGIYLQATSQVGFTTGGVQRMCISGTNIGIGKSAPTQALDVVGSISASETVAAANASFIDPTSVFERTTSGSRLWSGISSSSDGTKLAASALSGYIYTSSDSGVTWTERTGAGTGDWYSIASSSDGTKLAAGSGPGYIYTSSDSGVTWTDNSVSSGSRNWRCIASSSDGTKLAAGDFTGYIYTSSNSGVTWVEQTASGTRNWTSIASSSDGTKLAAVTSYGHVFTSGDSGASWTEQTGSLLEAYYTITSSSDGTKLAAAVFNGYIYTSSDSGVTWTERTGAGTGEWNAIASSSDGTKLAAVGNARYIYVSTDSGVTWRSLISGGTRNWANIASSSDGTKLATNVFIGYIYTIGQGATLYTSNGNVGVKTATPLYPLDVSGAANASRVQTNPGTASSPTHTFNTDLTSGMYLRAASQLAFSTAGVQRVVISNSNVGIGTAGPAYPLDISCVQTTPAINISTWPRTPINNTLILRGFAGLVTFATNWTTTANAINSNLMTVVSSNISAGSSFRFLKNGIWSITASIVNNATNQFMWIDVSTTDLSGVTPNGPGTPTLAMAHSGGGGSNVTLNWTGYLPSSSTYIYKVKSTGGPTVGNNVFSYVQVTLLNETPASGSAFPF